MFLNANCLRICCALIAAILLFSSSPSKTTAEIKKSKPNKLLIGAADLPPYSMKTSDGKWEGFGIDLWRAVAKEWGVQFDIREYKWTREISQAIQAGEIDLTTAVPVTEANEIILDLSHTIHRSGLGIAVRADFHSPGWFNYIKGMASFDILKAVSLLLLLSLLAGIIIWLLESGKNRDMFGEKLPKGLGQGLWWALVTMTTVGYGDKAPKTVGGRIVAVIWMLFSIILIISYTAAITTSFAVHELQGRVKGPRDLPEARVGVLNESETYAYLHQKGIPLVPFEKIHDGLQAVIEDRVDAFVDDAAQLKYLVKKAFPGQLHVLPETFSHYYMSMALPSGSQYRESLNRALSKIIQQDDWIQLKERYFGTVHQ